MVAQWSLGVRCPHEGPLKEYTRAMLHTIVTKEPVAAQLITWHNLWFMLLGEIVDTGQQAEGLT